jgi:type III restriction enzyme
VAKRKTVIAYQKEIPEVPGRDPHAMPEAFLETREGYNEVEVVEGRRPSSQLLVTKMREAVDAWRLAGYPGVSNTTLDLFRWWFEEAETTSDSAFTPYWGQREAVETLVYLLEVARVTDMQQLISSFALLPPSAFRFQTTPQGIRQLEMAGLAEPVDLPPDDIARYAFKMATGSGKTLVMAMLIVWSYFHARRETSSPMTTNFLVIAPNVIVFERLRVDFEDLRVFRDLDLSPPGWELNLRVILRGDSAEPAGAGNLVLTNIQQLYDRPDDRGQPTNPIQRLLGKRPVGGSETSGRPMLERVRELNHLLVINDEAHHVHDEELKWNQTIQGLHGGVRGGLAAWLDFSATPRFQGGSFFPWAVCDYPLAQAVEDGIVKAPMIVRLVDKPDPGAVTGKNLLLKYHDWLVAGLKRLRDHERIFKQIPGARPVMFVMCESIQHADLVGEWLRDQSGGRLKADEVLVIHTDREGEVKKGDLDDLRKAARDIDEPSSRIRAVVSVLVLREGWDVRNVTIVLGLRPGTATSKILPEQAVGRGLRLMRSLGPEYRQVLEVMGTPAFESFIQELEGEGVHVPVRPKAPTDPITIQPVAQRKRYDISIPRTGAGLRRTYKKLEGFDPASAEQVFDKKDAERVRKLRIEVEDAMNKIKLGQEDVSLPQPPLQNEIIAAITMRTQEMAGLTMDFSELVPMVKTYLRDRAFGEKVDLDANEVRQFLSRFAQQDHVASYLARSLGELTTEEAAIVIQPEPLRLLDTPAFLWRRQKLDCKKTVFNHVAVFNPFEGAFAEFLDRAPDVQRFAALAESFTGFWVDYLKPTGAVGRYFPDWVVVQKTGDEMISWIVETKGRVWPGTEAKDAAVDRWTREVSKSGQDAWKYIRVNQIDFQRIAPGAKSFGDLVERLSSPKPPILTVIEGQANEENLSKERDQLPYFTLDAAAGYFGLGQEIEVEAHIEVDFPVEQGMFAAKIPGRSMEPLIPEGAIALFREYEGGPRDDKVLLVQGQQISDPDTGSSHTVRRFSAQRVFDDVKGIARIEVRLLADNGEYRPIVLRPEEEADIQVLAVFDHLLAQPSELAVQEDKGSA